MSFAINTGTAESPILEYLEVFKEKGIPKFFDAFGIKHPAIYLQRWTEEYRNSRGIYTATAGTFDSFSLRSIGSTLSMSNGIVSEAVTTEDIPLAEIQTRELSNTYEEYEEAMEQIKNGYPQSERETWRKQEEQARAYKADSNAATPFLTKLVEVKKLKNPTLTVSQISDKIITNADAYELLAAEITGAKQNKEDGIKAAITAQEVWDAIQ